MSRGTASHVGETRSNGCMRADTYKLPIIRMTNVSLEPGDWDYNELIEDTRDGILMDTNYGWSIDQKRYNFQFNCEKGYRIKRSEEHTSELQSQSNLVCRLLLEKKNIR